MIPKIDKEELAKLMECLEPITAWALNKLGIVPKYEFKISQHSEITISITF